VPSIDDEAAAGALALYGPLGTQKTRRNLGRSVKLEADRRRSRAAQLVFTGADTPDSNALGVGDALASTCTITLGIIQQNVGADEPVAQIEGVIEWGTDGTSAAARFDWLNGGVVTVAGSSFKVSAELVSIPEGRSVEVSAFIGYYTVPCCSARLTRVAEAGAATTIPIPQMAQTVLPLVDDGTGATVQFTTDANGAIPLYGVHTFPAGSALPPIHIPPGAAAVVVTPTDAALALPVLFDLSM